MTKLGLVDFLYDVPPARLFFVVLTVAVAANLVPLGLGLLFPRLVLASWIAITLVWTVLVIASLLAHRKRAVWFVLTAPVAFLGPTAYMVLLLVCIRTNSCP